MSFPACFDSQRDYDQWSRLARRSGEDPAWPCIDCTDEFQRRMDQLGRCAYPKAIPGERRPCPAPSAADTPEASSGRTPEPAQRRGRPKGKRKASQKAGRKARRSAPTAAKSSPARSGKSGKKKPDGPTNSTRRSP